MVDNLIGAFSAVQKISYGMVIALILVTVFLIINTIKLTIFSRKREISIMRLVGASNFTIKTPFIIEGMILGFLGSIIPILIICFGLLPSIYNITFLLFISNFKFILLKCILLNKQPSPEEWLLLNYHLKQHDSQTRKVEDRLSFQFGYHLKQHDSQTRTVFFHTSSLFGYHLKQHDSQTRYRLCGSRVQFGYHLKQHDSQTHDPRKERGREFGYHLKQHDSQTVGTSNNYHNLFGYHLKQHDSQTRFPKLS